MISSSQLSNMKLSRVVLVCFLAVIIIMVPSMTYLDTIQGDQKSQRTFKTRNIDVFAPPPSNFNGLYISCNVTNIDIPNSQFKARFVIRPIGSLAVNGADPVFNRPSVPFTMILGPQIITFPANRPITAQSVDLPFTASNINKYPFDRFESEFILNANVVSSNTSLVNASLPIGFSIVGTIQSIRFDADLVDDVVASAMILNIKLFGYRSFTVQFFSMFILICMWILSFTIFILSVTLWFRDRKVEPPTIAITTSLLFALPAVRNTQPGIPNIGCTVDLAGFFWNMFLVMVSSVLLMTNYILKYQRDNKFNKAP
ncbi:hypothetical protein BC833DRAFT_572656 [Globomyces pollinis-pini]|nr:hypothetical protein BC833DRAFT_572656 [Globomyces pollinis-pini]